MKIYHNPKCSKSRQTLQIINDKNIDVDVILYLNNPPNAKELESVLTKLNIAPLELIRKSESIWKDNFKGKSFSDKELIDIMVANPKLIERPIVVARDKAIIGRPPEDVLELL